MQIEKNKVASFHYQLYEGDALLENSEHSEPATYLHGHNTMLIGVEEQLAGKQAGEKFEFTVTPENGYGVIRPDSIQRVSLKHVHHEGKGKPRCKPGDVVVVNTPEGGREVTVVKVGKFNIDVDTNHPFAGKTLIFKVEVVDIRDATEEEISHGHVHGPGGHAH